MPSNSQPPSHRRLTVLLVLLVLLMVGYWGLPISGQVVVAPNDWEDSVVWPKIRLEPPDPQLNQEAVVVVTDTRPWTHVKLVINGANAEFLRYEGDSRGEYWSWYWSFTVPSQAGYELGFYYDCDTGCIERARFSMGPAPELVSNQRRAGIPTKLGVVFADPGRDWHNRSGWDVELTYARQEEADYWSIDDLAARVQQASDTGLRVLVRVDYDLGQALPPADDYLALDVYLKYLARLARDARLKDVYGYVIGSGYNGKSSNSQAPERLVTSEWYARVFNGYGADPTHTDNVVEVIRAENPATRVMVGPVRPWIEDQNGKLRYRIDIPWLNYMNTLVAALNESAAANEEIGIPLTGPDGFAVQAPGRPNAPQLTPSVAANEPHLDLTRSGWNGAQAGFRVYRDWLDIINTYPHTRGLPVYITSTNTFTPDTGVKPAENYPRGWLTTALEVVNQEPQVLALCWFIDTFPMDAQWEYFSLTNPVGLLIDAADEFDQLLRSQP